MPQSDDETTEHQDDPSTEDDHAAPPASTTPPDEPGNDGDENDKASMPSLAECHDILQECKALVIYLARHGNALQGGDEIEESYKQLISLVSQCKGRPLSSEEWQNIMQAYTNVTRFTYETQGVNGRSVLDTWGERDPSPRHWWDMRPLLLVLFAPKRYERPLTTAIWLSVAAILLQCLAGWIGRAGDTSQWSTGWRLWFYIVGDLTPLLIPAVWGGIGSCVFLMKRLSDKLAALAYEESRLRGDGTRIFLGAIFGVLIVQMFFSTEQTDIATMGDISLVPMTAAFVAGLGVKPIYAAFEAVIESLAARVSDRRNPEA